MNHSKVDAILGMRPPMNGAELGSLLGSAGYYARFIKYYAMIVRPRRRMQLSMAHKLEPCSDKWTDTHEESDRIPKAMLASAPIRMSPNFGGRPFTIIADASDCGIGCCCAQYDDAGMERPVAFLSRELSKAETGVAVSDKEGLGVTWATKKLR